MFVERFRYLIGGQLDSVHITGGGITFLARKYGWNPQSGALDTIRLGGGGSTSISNNRDGQTIEIVGPGGDGWTTIPTAVHDPAQIATSASYAQTVNRFVSFDVAQRIARQIVGDGLTGRAFGYDGLGRLIADTAIAWVDTSSGGGGNPCTGNPPPDVDENGNVCTYGGGSEGGYWSADPANTHAYSYDSVGNRLDQSGDYGPGNRIRQFGGCTYVTDSLGDGNVLSRTCGAQTVRFHWTAESRLKALKVVGGDSLDLRYDAIGRLVRRDVNGSVQAHFLWQGENLLAELTAGATGKVAEYSYYPGLDNPHAVITGTTPYFAHRDGIGNVIALTDSATQTVQRSYDYDVWGGLTGGSDVKPFANTDRPRFKGALWLGPQADFYYMRARWYEPKSGRFLSEDPVGLQGGINPYVYVHNDPVNSTDPLGTEACPPGTTAWREVSDLEIAPGLTIEGRYMECRGAGGHVVYISMDSYTGPAPGDGNVAWGLQGEANPIGGRPAAEYVGAGALAPDWAQCMANAAGYLGGAAKIVTATAVAAGSYVSGSQMLSDGTRVAAAVGTPAAIFQTAPALEGAIYTWGGTILQGAGVTVLGFLGGYFAAAGLICAFDGGSY
jgi:RHS repeat-associated protein